MANKIIVTGGAGFIGSAVVRHIIHMTGDQVCIIDKLTYAGHLESLESVSGNSRCRFEKADICDKAAMDRIFADFQPDIVMHLAAESHVDRSIDGPGEFIQTNIVGTYTLLEAARKYFNTLGGWPVRDDIEPAEGSTPYSELHVSDFNVTDIYENINPVRDFWTLLG